MNMILNKPWVLSDRIDRETGGSVSCGKDGE